MNATHFGAGNIGRGFIGLLLSQSGYEVEFIDVNDKVIDEINKEKSYRVILADEQKSTTVVKGIKGLNSGSEKDKVIEAIAHSSIVTTAVGPHILKFIAPLIAEGLKLRIKNNGEYLNIIACENMVGGSSELKKYVLESLNREEKEWVERHIGFPNSAVDRIVPNQNNDRLLDVLVEPFYEWVIDQTELKGEKPKIKGALFVENLPAYIERKLFTVNTGHAATAYLGKILGTETIAASIENDVIKSTVMGALSETGKVLISKYGFSQEEHHRYIDKIIGRFKNEYIIDHVERVGRAPIRKLGRNDRLVAPALKFIDLFGEVPQNLVIVMAAALHFSTKEDTESIKLQEEIASKGIATILSETTGLDENHLLTQSVKKAYKDLEKNQITNGIQ